jgi:hypothetical protein
VLQSDNLVAAVMAAQTVSADPARITKAKADELCGVVRDYLSLACVPPSNGFFRQVVWIALRQFTRMLV